MMTTTDPFHAVVNDDDGDLDARPLRQDRKVWNEAKRDQERETEKVERKRARERGKKRNRRPAGVLTSSSTDRGEEGQNCKGKEK